MGDTYSLTRSNPRFLPPKCQICLGSLHQIADDILNKSDSRLADLPAELRGDKHFVTLLLQSRNEFYQQLSYEEQCDPDFALAHLEAILVDRDGRLEQQHLFDAVPDKLRLDAGFLLQLKEVITNRHGRNLIPPENFGYLWSDSGLAFAAPDSPLGDYQFWLDYYDGDHEQAFKTTVHGKPFTPAHPTDDNSAFPCLVPRDVLLNELLIRENAADFYSQLPQELKADDELARTAFTHDIDTFQYLPQNARITSEPETWSAVADTKKYYRHFIHPDFPVGLLNHSELVNKIVATHPELLENFSDQPKKLKQILSQLTAENVVVFASAYEEAFDMLPAGLKHSLGFAKKVIEYQNYSLTAERLLKMHGEDLALWAIEKDPDSYSQMPENILNLPEVVQIYQEKIRTSQDSQMPRWARNYFQAHPEELPDLIDSKPEWFEEILAYYSPRDEAKEDVPFELARDHFDRFVTTPERMRNYLFSLPPNPEAVLNHDLVESLIFALNRYGGVIDSKVSDAAERAAFTAVGDKSENPRPEYPEDLARLLLNKYHTLPEGLKDADLFSMMNFADQDGVMAFYANSSDSLSNECVTKIYNTIKNDPDLISQATKIDVKILKAVPEDDWLKWGPDLVAKIDSDLSLLGRAYSLLPENLRSDRGLALRAAVADPDNYFYLPQSLLQDQAFVTELCGWAEVPAYDLEKMSYAAQVAAIARFPFQFHLVEPELRNNPKFLQDCLAQNMWLFAELTAEEQSQAWPGFKEQLVQNGFRDVNSWSDFVAVLRTKSVLPRRIRSLEGWKVICPELFTTTAESRRQGQHKVLFLVSKEDWNGAFASLPLVDRLLALGIQDVTYQEVGSESDVKKILAEAKASGTAYDEIFLAGHGTQDSLALGGEDRRVSDSPEIKDEQYIDFGDFDAGDFDFASVLKKDGRLIDFSCSNGEGADKADNLANRFATTLTKDQTVVASQVVTNIAYMDRADSGHIHVYWFGNSPYLVQGKKPE